MENSENKTGDDAQTYAEGVNTALESYKTLNDKAIEDMDAAKQDKSSELSLGSAAGAWQTLATINGYSTNCGTGKTCALSNVNGNISWVAVVD